MPSVSPTAVSRAPTSSSLTKPSNAVYRAKAAPAAVLDEDVYVDAVSKIIQRDFFPDLERLKMQNDYLNAVQGGEYTRARLIGGELQRLATGTPTSSSFGTPRATALHGFDTPMSQSSVSSVARSDVSRKTDVGPAHDTTLSLDAFQTRYTSEDNASFADIVQKANENMRDRYSWVFNEEQGHLRLEEGRAAQQLKIGDGFEKGVDGWKYKAKNSLMYYPDGAPETIAEQAARGAPKAVSHSATRFDATVSTSDLLRSAESESRMQTQDVWNQMAKDTPGLLRDVDVGEKVQGYGFVPMTPVLQPDEDVDPSSLMTWGTIEGTPLLMDHGADHSARNFTMPATPRREALSHKLSEKASKNLRHRATSTVGASTPGRPLTGRTTPGAASPYLRRQAGVTVMSTLSPAAQHLLGKGKRGTTGLGALRKGPDAQLRASYSMGSPLVGRALTGASQASSTAPLTPFQRSGQASRQALTPMRPAPTSAASPLVKREKIDESSLTDNLLQL
ncbi:DiGeorge syndrome critical region protein 14 [Thoreauomyces humboldtii]|nr:DiGeorge syndrome critical region protein 14 [Thoreauomyces humboldtii]